MAPRGLTKAAFPQLVVSGVSIAGFQAHEMTGLQSRLKWHFPHVCRILVYWVWRCPHPCVYRLLKKETGCVRLRKEENYFPSIIPACASKDTHHPSSPLACLGVWIHILNLEPAQEGAMGELNNHFQLRKGLRQQKTSKPLWK